MMAVRNDMRQIRWAVVGTGRIARQFAQALQNISQAVGAAVVSRTMSSAEQYAEEYGFLQAYDSYGAMLREVQPDIVYIALPNDCHFSYAMEAMEAGCGVLIEKPMADNMRQVRQLLEKAKEKHVFLMEGLWTRCFPTVKQVRQWLADGEIGAPRSVRAYFDALPDPADFPSWKITKQHTAGALRDIGIYGLAMVGIAFPCMPEKIHGNYWTNGDADIHMDLLLQYPKGGAAYISASYDRISENTAEIVGERGRILIGDEFWHPSWVTLKRNDGSSETVSLPLETSGFEYEIESVMDALGCGLQECPVFSWEESIRIGTIIETVRESWGIRYDSDDGVPDNHGIT